MDIKINKEIRDYSENMIIGLNLRQAIFCILAMLVSAGLYFLLKDRMYLELISWICVIAAFPFVFLGFFKYHELPAEKILRKVIIHYLQKDQMTYTTTSIFSEVERKVRKDAVTNAKKHRTGKKREQKNI